MASSFSTIERMMLRDRLAYDRDRGEEVDDAWVRRYEESVMVVKGNGGIRPGVVSSLACSNRIVRNIELVRKYSKIGNKMTVASIGLPTHIRAFLLGKWRYLLVLEEFSRQVCRR